MNVMEWLRSLGRRAVIPVGGLIGTTLTGVTVRAAMLDPEVKAESAARLYLELGTDAVFHVGDVVVEAEALGASVHLPEDRPPEIRRFVLVPPGGAGPPDGDSGVNRSIGDLEQTVDTRGSTRAGVTVKCISLLAARLPGAMILAQVTGPLTIASGLMGYEYLLRLVRTNPTLVERVLDLCTRIAVDFAHRQLRAGAGMLWLGEPMGAIISPAAFERLCVPRLHRVLEQCPERNILHICGDTTPHLQQLLATGARVLSLDTAVDLPSLIERVPADVALMGNVDPVRVVQQGSAADVRAAANRLLKAMEPYDNFILSTGCSVPRTSPLQNVRALVEAGRAHRRETTHTPGSE